MEYSEHGLGGGALRRTEDGMGGPESTRSEGTVVPIGRDGWSATDQQRSLTALLSQGLGRRRANTVAENLLLKFGSFPAALTAPQNLLEEIPGVGSATVSLLRSVLDVTQKIAAERIELDRPVVSSWSSLIDYLHVSMAFEALEQFRILYLDAKHRVIANEVQQVGVVNHTPVYIRKVIQRALDFSALGLILVHNHPSGDPAPSAADIRMTQEIEQAGRLLGLTLYDHIIVGFSGHTSLKALQLI